MAIPYVKFFRGTPTAFENLVNKNDDTLYFISATDENTGELYLGNKLISDNINSVAELEDILLSDLLDGQLLSYDGTEGKWVNKSVLEAIGLFGPASGAEQGSNGLVPAPGAGMQNAFLRGDGQWVTIEIAEEFELNADEKSVSIVNEVIALKDFGIKYYKFIPETDNVAAHYEAQLVDGEHPWKEGLEPKIVLENGELILGWFEPNSATIEGVTEQVLTLQGQVDTLIKTVEEKANVSDVYTKKETIDEINAAIAATDHMVRKTFDTLADAKAFALEEGEEAVKYIFMVKRENDNGYDEYLYVNGELDLVGNWETDLTDYAKKDELNLKVDKEEGKSLVLDTEITKLASVQANAEPNYITSVKEDELKVENGLLSVISIVPSKVTGLEDLLNNKANASTLDTLSGKVSTLEINLGAINTKVTNLEKNLNNYVTLETYNAEIAEIKDAITWKEITNN